MNLLHALPAPDLMPPPFSEGLDDWSRGDGTPDSPTYDGAENARIARGDAHFGTCLELRKVEPVQRLRYMAELPMMTGSYLEVSARVKGLRGPLPAVRIAAWPGGCHGRVVPGLTGIGPRVALAHHGGVEHVRAVIGPLPLPGVDLVWDDLRVRYAHVGLDLVGPGGGVVRIAGIEARDVTRRFTPFGRSLPGFAVA